jgi:4-alpha-glucanotransferase
MKQRRAGVMVPLFSLASTRSWGIGEYRDLPVFADWVQSAGLSFVQILPITELPESVMSPYSALTAMAIDPMYIALPELEDFAAIGGEDRLPPADREALERVRASSKIEYRGVRALKSKWLRRAYDYFVQEARDSERAQRFRSFAETNAAWLDDYATFRALRQQHGRSPWWDWPEALRRHDAAAVAQARQECAEEIDYRKYLQWIAAEQWAAARRAASPVQIFGDVPFMISSDSPDVWSRQNEFRFDATVGVPPDAFSATGQDWGLPPWRWDVMAKNDFTWMKMRARRTAELFDGFRLDHLVGLYRTYIRPLDPKTKAFFAPADEAAQLALGERLVSLYAETGAEVIAEDLGTVPDFVRASLDRLRVPGFKVLRWEREWTVEGKPYIDPSTYREVSVATTGTHDTEPLRTWWESLKAAERADVLAMPSIKRYRAESQSELDALLRAVLHARSYLTIVPLQDLFGWTDRINTPAQISEENWTWRLPVPIDAWAALPETRQRAQRLSDWTHESGRNA